MAEGLARHYGMGRIDAHSAGVVPAPLNPRAVRVMAELNIDIANHTHRSLETVSIDEMDMVVTLCDYAQALSPRGPSGQHRLHWNIADPTALWGPDWLVLRTYRKVRDELDRRIRHLLPTILK
jgi:arsenate reductase